MIGENERNCLMITPRTRLSSPLSERITGGMREEGTLSGDSLHEPSERASGIRGFAAVLAFCFSFYVSMFLTHLFSDHPRKLFSLPCLDGRANGDIFLFFFSPCNLIKEHGRSRSFEICFNLFLIVLFEKTVSGTLYADTGTSVEDVLKIQCAI